MPWSIYVFVVFKLDGDESMEIIISGVIGALMWIMGSLFGSFFSLAFYRIPRGEDIIIKHSYCPNCKHKLAFWDLIPLISFLIRKGKCKYCSHKISNSYFILELVNAFVFLIAYLLLGYTVKLALVLILYVILFFAIGVIVSVKKNGKALKEAKKGVFVSELLVAMIIFCFVLTTMYLVTRNTSNRFLLTRAKSEALNLAIEQLETIKANPYEEVVSYEKEERIHQIDYHIKSQVTKLSEQDTTKQDLVKIVEMTVTYEVLEKPYELKIHTVKGRE